MYASLVNNELTIERDGETYIIDVPTEQLTEVRQMLMERDVSGVLACFSKEYRLNQEISSEDGMFIRKGNSLYMRGINVSIPEDLVEPILTKEDRYINFWKWAALNPDPAARDNLFWYIKKWGIDVTDEGLLVCFRNVVKREDGSYTDAKTGSFNINLFEEVTQPREECDANQNVTCSHGLHVASQSWLSANYFGDTGLVVLVNPMDVVAVPPVDGYGKMRCCRYFPVMETLYDRHGKIVVNDDELADALDCFNYESIEELETYLEELPGVKEGTVKVTFTDEAREYEIDYEAVRDVISKRLKTAQLEKV